MLLERLRERMQESYHQWLSDQFQSQWERDDSEFVFNYIKENASPEEIAEILDATKDSMFDEDIMYLAGELHTRRNELPDEIFAKYLFMYSSALSAKVADSITKILLTEKEMSDLCASIDEMENLSETILEENE